MGAYQSFLVVHNYQFGMGEFVNCRCPANLGARTFKAGKGEGVCTCALFKDYLYFYAAVVGGD